MCSPELQLGPHRVDVRFAKNDQGSPARLNRLDDLVGDHLANLEMVKNYEKAEICDLGDLPVPCVDAASILDSLPTLRWILQTSCQDLCL